PRKRAHPTPSWSHRSFESSRGASRQRHHNRGGTTRSGTAGEVIGLVRAWLAE
ncbi:unnamed protein product, partial [Ectocarpus sp. 13 AM-2016]